jgi:opacity protein-like surface antigen
MRKHISLIIQRTLLISLVFVTFSCSPEYLPNKVNTPLFEDKGEIQGSISRGISGTDAQLAYAVTDHIGVMANTSFRSQTSDTTDNFHKHNFVEFGAGYYSNVTDNAVFSIYGGYGFGDVKSYTENNLVDDNTTNADLHRIFIQPSFGVTTDYFDASIAPRFVLMDAKYNEKALNESSGYHPIIEPVVTTRFGFKNVKFITQAGLSIPFKGEKLDFDIQPFIFSVGLHLNFDLITKDESKSDKSSYEY